MKYVDVTRAILMALADAHPRGLHAEALAAMVNCERAALSRPLRLLSDTGAIRCHTARRGERHCTEVRLTDAALRVLSRGAGAS
jgi:hypothetical protein